MGSHSAVRFPGLVACSTLALVMASQFGVVTADTVPPSPVLRGPDGAVLPFEQEQTLLEYLRTADAVSSKTLPVGITKAKKVLLQKDGDTANVVFHTVNSHEQRTKRLPNGNVVLYVRDGFTSQLAAYEMSRLLGMANVPPTVERRIDSRRGSAQLWIENGMTELKRVEKGLEPPSHNLWRQRYSDMRVFDNLINNIDRNQGNLLIDPDWNLWLIDNTRSFGRDKTLPRPELVERCSRRLWQAIHELDEGTVFERLSPYLQKSEIKAIFSRRAKLIELLQEKISAKGEEWILFNIGDPDPGVEVRQSDASEGGG